MRHKWDLFSQDTFSVRLKKKWWTIMVKCTVTMRSMREGVHWSRPHTAYTWWTVTKAVHSMWAGKHRKTMYEYYRQPGSFHTCQSFLDETWPVCRWMLEHIIQGEKLPVPLRMRKVNIYFVLQNVPKWSMTFWWVGGRPGVYEAAPESVWQSALGHYHGGGVSVWATPGPARWPHAPWPLYNQAG